MNFFEEESEVFVYKPPTIFGERNATVGSVDVMWDGWSGYIDRTLIDDSFMDTSFLSVTSGRAWDNITFWIEDRGYSAGDISFADSGGRYVENTDDGGNVISTDLFPNTDMFVVHYISAPTGSLPSISASANSWEWDSVRGNSWAYWRDLPDSSFIRFDSQNITGSGNETLRSIVTFVDHAYLKEVYDQGGDVNSLIFNLSAMYTTILVDAFNTPGFTWDVPFGTVTSFDLDLLVDPPAILLPLADLDDPIILSRWNGQLDVNATTDLDQAVNYRLDMSFPRTTDRWRVELPASDWHITDLVVDGSEETWFKDGRFAWFNRSAAPDTTDSFILAWTRPVNDIEIVTVTDSILIIRITNDAPVFIGELRIQHPESIDVTATGSSHGRVPLV
jgi:hypothetical protein